MEEHFAVGNYRFYKQQLEGARSVMRTLDMNLTEEQREEMCDLSKDELYDLLFQIKSENEISVIRPQ
jgi:hypothetical protein